MGSMEISPYVWVEQAFDTIAPGDLDMFGAEQNIQVGRTPVADPHDANPQICRHGLFRLMVRARGAAQRAGDEARGSSPLNEIPAIELVPHSSATSAFRVCSTITADPGSLPWRVDRRLFGSGHASN